MMFALVCCVPGFTTKESYHLFDGTSFVLVFYFKITRFSLVTLLEVRKKAGFPFPFMLVNLLLSQASRFV